METKKITNNAVNIRKNNAVILKHIIQRIDTLSDKQVLECMKKVVDGKQNSVYFVFNLLGVLIMLHHPDKHFAADTIRKEVKENWKNCLKFDKEIGISKEEQYKDTNVDLKNIDSILNSMSVENIAEELGLKTKQVGLSTAVCAEDGNPIVMFSNNTMYID